MKLLWLSIPLIMLVACDDNPTSLAINDANVSGSGGSCITVATSSAAGKSSVSTKLNSSSVVLASSSAIVVSSSAGGTGILRKCDYQSVSATTGTLACDEKTYKTVVIGVGAKAQTWMVENLAYLPSVNEKSDHSTGAKYYVSGYDGTDVTAAKTESNYSIFGVLYNYQAALSACPNNWHLPSDDDWTILETAVGANAGRKLKADRLWDAGGITGTDDFGFSALPGGDLYDGKYYCVGRCGYWWTATPAEAFFAWLRQLVNDSDKLKRISSYKALGISVRCLKDSD